MGLMGSLISSDVSDVLKGVLKASPAGAAAQAMASLVKDTGMMDQMSKLLDGVVKKPKPGGIGNIADTVKKMTDGILKQNGLPTGMLPREFFDKMGGSKSAAAGQGGMFSSINKMVEQAMAATGNMGGAKMGGAKMASAAVGAAGMGGAKMGGAKMAGAAVGAAGMAGAKMAGAGMNPQTAAMVAGMQTMMQKTLFIAALQQIIQETASKQEFSLESSISKVWMKMNALRPQGRQDIQQINELFGALGGIMQKMNEMQKGVVQNLK